MNPTRHIAWLIVWCGIASAQDPPTPPDASDPARNGGQSRSLTPGDAAEPLRICARYVTSERDGSVERLTAYGGVEAWQGDRREPSFRLTCKGLVVWRTDTRRLDPATAQRIYRTEFYAECGVRFSRRREVFFCEQMYFDLDTNVALISPAGCQMGPGATGDGSTTARIGSLRIAARQLRELSTSPIACILNGTPTTPGFTDPDYRFDACSILLTSSRGERRIGVHPDREDDFIIGRVDTERVEAEAHRAFGSLPFTPGGRRLAQLSPWILDRDAARERAPAPVWQVEFETFVPARKRHTHGHGLPDPRADR